jgi:hypothetical protein
MEDRFERASTMTRSLRHLLWMLTVLLVAGAAAGAVPEQMSYAGQLDDNGAPANLSATMLFELYEDEAAGSAVWSETHGAVQVTDGYFTVELGETTPLSGVFDGSPLYLQVMINGQAMLPRTAVSSVPYAMVAGEVPFDNTASGLTATDVTSALDELAARIGAVEATNANQQSQINNNTTNIAALLADVGDYVTSAELTTTLSNYVTSPSLATTLAGYVTSADLTSLLSSYVTFSDLANALVNYVTSTDLTSALAGYATLPVTDALDARLTAAEGIVAAVETKTAAMTADATDVYFTGVNVHVRNGLGATNGFPAHPADDGVVNGLGNLIIGYDEARSPGSDKSGSHNLVVGLMNNYSSFGGLVAGELNAVTGPYASVSGGSGNTASGLNSSVSGGNNNTALESWSSVSGGSGNTASGVWSSVSGGASRSVAGMNSWAASGLSIVGTNAVFEGVNVHVRNGLGATNGFPTHPADDGVVNGLGNLIVGYDEARSPGSNKSGSHNLVVGLMNNYSSFGGLVAGALNAVTGPYASVSGGSGNTASGMNSSVSGGNNNTALESGSSVSGGYGNTALGWYSSVSGGSSRSASSTYDWAAGALFQDF